MNDERLDELLALAALGELTDAEERELDAALADDADAEAELRADVDVAAALQSGHDEMPSAGLRDRVLAAIEGVPQETTPVVSLDQRRATVSARRTWMPRLAAAAAVAVLAGGAVVVITRDERPAPTAITEAPDAVTRTFDGELAGDLTVVSSTSQNAVVIEGAGLDVLPSDQTYQLWRLEDDVVSSVGLFRAESSGRVLTVFDGVLLGDGTFAVTIEPAEGSATPSLPIVATT